MRKLDTKAEDGRKIRMTFYLPAISPLAEEGVMSEHREEQGRAYTSREGGRVYEKPSLEVIGSVKELTEGTVVQGGDAFLTGTTAS